MKNSILDISIKKNKPYIIVLGFVLLAVIIGIIVFAVFKNKNSSAFPKSYDFAVIDTTGQCNKSYIYYYNSSGKKIYEQQLNMGYMGDTFNFPQVLENNIYVVPWGLDMSRELSVMLELNIKSGKYSTYDTTLHSTNSFAITDQYFFSVNTINNTTKLARTNRETLKTDTIEFSKYYIGKIAIYKDVLYAFGCNTANDKNADLIEINTKTMKILYKENIREYGECPAASTLMIGDNLYFTFPYKNQTNEVTLGNTVTVFNIKTKSFTNITLPEDSPCQLLKYKDNIIISHINAVSDEGQAISILNTKTGTIKCLQLKNKPRQIAIRKNYLYSLDITNRNICKYELEDNEIRFLKMYKINKRSGNTFYFLAGLFLMEE